MIYESILNQEKLSSSSSTTTNLSSVGKFCLNTYEQQLEIDARISRLIKSLLRTEELRNQAEASGNNLKEIVSTTFNTLRINLDNLESKLNAMIKYELSQKSVETQVRSIESHVNQLIGNLKNMSMLTDSQKLLIIKNADSNINHLDSNINSLELSRTKEIERINAKTKCALNEISVFVTNRVQKPVQDENSQIKKSSGKMSLMSSDENSKKILGCATNEHFNYKEWLLKSNKLITEINQDEFKVSPLNLSTVDSFEDLSYNQDFEILTDSDDDGDEYQIKSLTTKSSEVSSFFQPKENLQSSFFNDIYSKPMEYWLLPRKQ